MLLLGDHQTDSQVENIQQAIQWQHFRSSLAIFDKNYYYNAIGFRYCTHIATSVILSARCIFL